MFFSRTCLLFRIIKSAAIGYVARRAFKGTDTFLCTTEFSERTSFFCSGCCYSVNPKLFGITEKEPECPFCGTEVTQEIFEAIRIAEEEEAKEKLELLQQQQYRENEY